MHDFIGGGAFPRNHTPRNPKSIKLSPRLLRLSSPPLAGPSETPNPKWLDHRGMPGAINFLSPPPYAKDGGTPVFGWPAASTWQGPVAAGVNPEVTGKIGQDKSRAALVRSAEDALTLAAARRSWGDLRSHGKMYNKPSPPDIWTKRDRAHTKVYRDRDSWGPSRSQVSEHDLALRYGFARFEECRERPDFPKPASAWT